MGRDLVDARAALRVAERICRASAGILEIGVNRFAAARVGRRSNQLLSLSEIQMKTIIIALVATAFSIGASAQTPAKAVSGAMAVPSKAASAPMAKASAPAHKAKAHKPASAPA